MWLYQCSKNNNIVCTKRGLALFVRNEAWQLKPPPLPANLESSWARY